MRSGYTIFTQKKWKRCVIRKAPKPFYGAIGVAIEGNIFTFGGEDSENFSARNALWKLSRSKEGIFTWSFIHCKSKAKSPSPRYDHTGWECSGKLWVFGGEGPLLEGYLNDHGDTDVPFLGFTFNNQLLCYDPTSQMWTNPQCFGTVPLPKGGRSSAIIKENVWLFGRSSDDFFHLNMRSFTWTQIQTGQPSPQVYTRCSLTAVHSQGSGH